MRVQLEMGNKTVDIENNLDVYKTADQKEMFLDILDDALNALGISGEDIVDHWTTKAHENESNQIRR